MTIPRISCTVTLDETVETHLRLMKRSGQVKKWRRGAIWAYGLIGGVAFGLVSRAFWVAGDAVLPILAIGAAVSTGIGFLGGKAYDNTVRRRVRKLVAETLGSAASSSSEIELRPAGVWVRQHNTEILFSWTDVTDIVDGPSSVDILFKQGIVVARDRAFPELAGRDNYLAEARRLASLPELLDPSPRPTGSS